MRWEKKAIAAHLIFGIFLVGAVLKAGIWVDGGRYLRGEMLRTSVINYRAAIGSECAAGLAPKKLKHHRRNHK
jgi:hypothetical protein